jgi:hypothetical protein
MDEHIVSEDPGSQQNKNKNRANKTESTSLQKPRTIILKNPKLTSLPSIVIFPLPICTYVNVPVRAALRELGDLGEAVGLGHVQLEGLRYSMYRGEWVSG